MAPINLSNFSNTILSNEKRLKVNSIQLGKGKTCIAHLIAEDDKQWDELKKSRFRGGAHISSQIKDRRRRLIDALERYDALLESRRADLQAHGLWIEAALRVPDVCISDRLLDSIEIQIAATQKLDEMTAEREENKVWNAFKKYRASSEESDQAKHFARHGGGR
jgi:hypothetical protein